MTKTSTQSQRVNSIYRRQIAMDRKLTDIEAVLRLDHQCRVANREIVMTLAAHLARVLRQNDTLRAALGPVTIAQLASANHFMGEKL